MLKKLIKLVTNNFGLKILAVFSAVVLWLLVVNIDDPTQTQSFTASINVENADYMTELGKYFEPQDSNMTVSFKVSAKRSVMRYLSNADFRATADMENIQETEGGMYRVPLDIVATRYASSVTFEGKTRYMEVNVENLMTEQFPIQATAVGTPAEGYAVGTLKVAPNILKVTGPESVVSQIDRAVATIDVTGASSDLTDSVTPVVYDAGGSEVASQKLSFHIDKVTVAAEMLNVKSLLMEIEPSGEVAEGYACTGVSINPTRIAVKGTTSALNASGSIVIPSERLNISGADADVVRSIDIREYLPEGLELVDASAHMIEVTASVEQIVSQNFDIPLENITLQNLRTGYEASIESTSVSVTLFGLRRDLDALQAGTLKGVVNLGGLDEGSHSVPLILDVDSELYRQSEATVVMVRIEQSVSIPEGGGADGGSTGGGTGTGGSGNGTGGSGTEGAGSGNSGTGSTGASGDGDDTRPVGGTHITN